MNIVINVNVDADKDVPKVEVKQPVKKVVKKKPFNGVIQFPEPRQSSSVLDILGIKET
jgi:hypothetical protein